MREIQRIKDFIVLNKESLQKLEKEIYNERKQKEHFSLKLKDLYMQKYNEG